MATNIWRGATTAWATVSNWSLGTAPATGEDIIIPANATFGIAGGDFSAALLASFTIENGFSKTLGSATTALKFDADAISLAGTGQQFLDINNPTSDVIVTEAASDTSSRHGLNIVGVGIARLSINIASGTVGVAAGAGETCTCSAIVVTGAGSVEVGAGVTKVGGGVPDITVMSGTVDVRCAVGTVITAGTLTHHAGASTSITATGGTLTVNSSGTPTLLTIVAATLIMGPSAGNPTTLTISGKGWRIEDPFGRITTPWDFPTGGPWDGTALVPVNKQWTPAAIS